MNQAADRKPHLSYSQIGMYMRCGMQYYYRYIRKLTIPPGAALVFGKSFHSVVEHAYKEMMQGQAVSTGTLQDVFVTSFRGTQNVVYQEDESEEQLIDLGTAAVPVYHGEVIQQTEPVAVEKRFSIEFNGIDYTLDGVVDLVTADGQVRDNKTSGKKYSQTQTDNDLQLAIYSIAEQKEKVGHDVLVKTKTPQTQRLHHVVTDKQRERALVIMQKAAEGIGKQVFTPTVPDNWMCSPAWCGYYEICHKEI